LFLLKAKVQIALTKIKISGACISTNVTFNHYFTATVLYFIANVNIELLIILRPIIQTYLFRAFDWFRFGLDVSEHLLQRLLDYS